MIFIALGYILIFLETLIGLVIVGKNVGTIVCSLHTKMIVGCLGKHTFSVSRLDDALSKGDRCRYAITLHLKHGIRCIFVNIFLSCI